MVAEIVMMTILPGRRSAEKSARNSGMPEAWCKRFLRRWNYIPICHQRGTDGTLVGLLDPALCLRLFKSNRDAGLILFAGLLLDAAAQSFG
jgi:hypothetical protein